jgi:hypothetical protein
MVPHTETVKEIFMNLCLKQLHFGVMALLNFRAFEDSSLSSMENVPLLQADEFSFVGVFELFILCHFSP